MKAIRPMLLESFEKNDNSNGWGKIITTPLNYIDNDGSANLKFIQTQMSQSMFLQKIIGPSMTAMILQDDKDATERAALNETQAQQKSRLQQFLLVLEQKEKGEEEEIGSKIRRTNELLSKNNIEDAVSYARQFINGKYKGVTVEGVISTNEGLAAALRAMGNTTAAGEIMVKSGQTNLEKTKTSQAEALKEELNTALKDTNKNRKNAERVFQETINHLDPRDPNRAILENNKEDAIESLRQTATIVEVTDNYIKKHGDNDLPFILKEYNDMKGLYGAFNFTDENAKLTREIAILIASFIITAGASAMLTGIAGGARAIAIGRTAAAAKHFQNGNRIRGALNAGASGAMNAAELGLKGGVTGLNAANKAKLGFAADALVFTSAVTVMRWVWSQEGEASTGF